MSERSEANVIREITARIDAAIAENRRNEIVIVGTLIALFIVGLTLIIWGAAVGRWKLLVPGGIVQLTVVWPIRKLIRLREENMRLQIIPQLLRLAEKQQAESLAAKLIEKLIEQV